MDLHDKLHLSVSAREARIIFFGVETPPSPESEDRTKDSPTPYVPMKRETAEPSKDDRWKEADTWMDKQEDIKTTDTILESSLRPNQMEPIFRDGVPRRVVASTNKFIKKIEWIYSEEDLVFYRDVLQTTPPQPPPEVPIGTHLYIFSENDDQVLIGSGNPYGWVSKKDIMEWQTQTVIVKDDQIIAYVQSENGENVTTIDAKTGRTNIRRLDDVRGNMGRFFSTTEFASMTKTLVQFQSFLTTLNGKVPDDGALLKKILQKFVIAASSNVLLQEKGDIVQKTLDDLPSPAPPEKIKSTIQELMNNKKLSGAEEVDRIADGRHIIGHPVTKDDGYFDSLKIVGE